MNKIKVVKITALWCSACLIMNKVWNKISKEYAVDVVNLDYDLDEEKVAEYKIDNILPVFIFYSNNLEVKRLEGEHSYDEIKEIMEEIIHEKSN